MEKGDAPVHIVNNGVGNLVVGVADDIGHLGVVHAVEHLIHDEGGDIQGHHAVEGAVDVAEGDGHRHNDQQIHRQKQPPHGQPGQLQLEQAGNEIGAAGGGALEKHHAQEPPMITPPKMHPRMGSIGSKVWIMWRMSMKMEEMNME